MKLVSWNLVSGYDSNYSRSDSEYLLILAPGTIFELKEPPLKAELEKKKKFFQYSGIDNSGYEIAEIELDEVQAIDCMEKSEAALPKTENAIKWRNRN